MATADIHTYTRVKQYSHASVELAQARPNRATKRDCKRAKNLRANVDKTPMTSRQILVSVRRRGPLTGVYLPHGSSTKILLYIYKDIYNSLVENCTMHSFELYFMQYRDAETKVS